MLRILRKNKPVFFTISKQTAVASLLPSASEEAGPCPGADPSQRLEESGLRLNQPPSEVPSVDLHSPNSVGGLGPVLTTL